MPTYSIQLPNGSEVDYEGDAPPDAIQYRAILKSQGLDVPQEEASSIARRIAGDIPLGLAKGVIGAGESVVGLADIAHRLNPISAIAHIAGMDIGSIGNMLGELGYKPKEAKQILADLQTKELKDAQQQIAEAKGFIPTAAALAQRPSAIADLMAESAPSMIGGAGAARKIASMTPGLAASAAALGEGAMAAGSMAEGVRQDTGGLTAKQAALAAGSGIATSGLSVAGGAAAQKLGIADIDTLLASGKITKAEGSRLKMMALGALTEGVLEEAPQSAQEQAARNLALDKPIREGVSEAAASGMMLGGVMGAGSNITAQADQAASAKTAVSASSQANDIAMKKPSQSDNLAAAMALEQITKQPEPTNADPEGKVVIGNIGASGSTPGMLDVYSPAPLADKSAEESALAMLAAEPAVPANPAADTALAQGTAATPQDVEWRAKDLNQKVVERYWRAKKDLTKAEQDLAIKQQLAKEESFKIDERKKVADTENYAQELVAEVARQEGVPYDDVVKTRANHPNVTAWIEDLESRWIKGYGVSETPRPTQISDLVASGKGERRLLNQENYISSLNARNEQSRAGAKSGLGESLEGYQPVPAEESLDFGIESIASPEAQSEQGLGFLTKVKAIQENMAKVGVDLPRETAVKMARLSPEEFVQARQQLINSVPKEGKPASGDVKMKSIANLEAGFFPPGEDFPQATPQNIAATDSVINWLKSKKLSEPGMTFSGEAAILVKSWDLAIDAAIAAIKAGKAIAQATAEAIEVFKKNYPSASKAQIDLLKSEIEDVASAPATPATESDTKKERKYAEGVWRPFLTDFSKSAIAQRKDMAGTAMRWFGETPVARAIETGAKLMKNAGTIADNIFNVLPAAKGVFSKMNQAMSDAIVLWTDKSLPPIKEARKVFGSKFDDFSRLLISRTFTGDSAELDALVASTPGGAEILAKIEANKGWGGVREAMFNAEKAVRAGDDSFKKQDNYYPLVVADGQLENLLDLISENGDRHEVEKVLNQAKRDKAKETGDKGAELTREEQGAIIGKHIFGTLFQGRGAPGFTKKRNIATITKEMSKFIEPIDVAIETRIMQVAKDVTARQFFGKIDTSGEDILPTDIEPTSPFGLVLADAIKNKEITPEGLDVILDNVKDYFSNNRGASPAAWKFGRFIGDMAVYAHLNSFSSAFINAADAFSTAAREGPSAAAQALGAAVGHRLSKIPGLSSFEPETYTTLKDIKFHEGAMDTAEYMRGNGAFKKFLRESMKFIQGSMDSFGKEIALNAARINASNVMRSGEGRSLLATRDQQFARIQEVMSKTHPDIWPEMKKSLMSEGFSKNDLDDMGRLYLRERLSDAQPMTRAEQAQGKLALHPGFKPIFALKSFMLRQIGTIRNNTYEELKRGNVGAAAAWFGTYALWTMAGQVIVRCMVAKAMRKDCGGLDSWLSAFTGIFGMNKYSLSGLTRGDPAGTAIDMITPPLTPINSLFKDAMLTRDAISGRKIEGTGRPVVRNIRDFLGQAESYKHLPMGKDVYDWFGAGRTKELKKQAEEKRGKKEKTIMGELKNMVVPTPKKAN